MNEKYLKEKEKIFKRAEERAQKIIKKYKKDKRFFRWGAVG